MSRGRGGGRGGRGGGRGGRPNVPWDTGDEPDARPSELFPPYNVPVPRTLSAAETSSIHHFLLLRRQIHSSPIYTSKRTQLPSSDPTAPRKVYTLAQNNALYGVRSKASVDPFTAMPTYSQRFVREERALPDWTRRPVCREVFPEELRDTVDPQSASARGRGNKRRKLELSSINALPNAEEAFGMAGAGDEDYAQGGAASAAGGTSRGEGSGQTLLEQLAAIQGDEGDAEGQAGGGADADEEDGRQDDEDEDEVYDDEDAGDYDAEGYFDDGDELGEDYGDADDGEGTF